MVKYEWRMKSTNLNGFFRGGPLRAVFLRLTVTSKWDLSWAVFPT